GIADRNDLHANLVQQLRGDAACIPESLNGRGGALVIDLHDLAGATDHIDTAARCGFMASKRAAQKRWFTGDHSRDSVATRHAVGVHDPGHHLRVSVNIGSGNIAVGANEVRYLIGIAPGETLEFSMGKILGIADDAALGAAKRNVYGGAFPRHPGRQRLHFIEADIGMVADAALAWPA